MSVVGIAMVRDEADIIERTIEHMHGQVDGLIVADNLSADGTYEILARSQVDVLLTDSDPAYNQADKMTKLAQVALMQGATWVVPFDADELWFASNGDQTVRDFLNERPASTMFVTADLFHFLGVDYVPVHPFDRMRWRQPAPLGLPKVAARAHPSLKIEMGNHAASIRTTSRDRAAMAVPGLRINHYPYRSEEQFVRKVRNGAAALARTDLPETQGAHWRMYGRILDEHGEDALVAHYQEHFTVEGQQKKGEPSGLVYDYFAEQGTLLGVADERPREPGEYGYEEPD